MRSREKGKVAVVDDSSAVEVVHLRAAGVSLVLDFPPDSVPVVAHWGEDLGDLPAGLLRSLCRAQVAPFEKDPLDASVRPGLIPLASDGWKGSTALPTYMAALFMALLIPVLLFLVFHRQFLNSAGAQGAVKE